MYYTIKQINKISHNCRTGKVLTDKLIPFNKDLKLFEITRPVSADKQRNSDNTAKFIVLNPLMPVEILSAEWNNWNEPDIIKYKSSSGGVYIVQDEKILIDINEFMQVNCFKGRLPYLHIKDKDGWECYSAPEDIYILEYLWAHFYNYGIYTVDGELVQEENKEERRFTAPEIF
jgi:hypothetical protein